LAQGPRTSSIRPDMNGPARRIIEYVLTRKHPQKACQEEKTHLPTKECSQISIPDTAKQGVTRKIPPNTHNSQRHVKTTWATPSTIIFSFIRKALLLEAAGFLCPKHLLHPIREKGNRRARPAASWPGRSGESIHTRRACPCVPTLPPIYYN
jgi:hypothetical protein